MEKFVTRYRPFIAAVLCGFDRLVFRGTLLPLIMPRGMFNFLTRANVRLLDFKEYVLATSERLKQASLAEAVTHDRPIRYLHASTTDKEGLARRLLADLPQWPRVARPATRAHRHDRLHALRQLLHAAG